MKRYVLLLILVFPLLGMQQPNPFVDEFYIAVREGNLAKVSSLASQPVVQNAIRTNQQYATEAVLKFPPRFPQMITQYMQIARLLVNQGGKIHPQALSALEVYEKSQFPNIKPHPKARPLTTAPLQPIAKPTPVVTPVAKPTATYTVSSSITSSGKQPADFHTLEELLRQPIKGGQEIKNYINTHTLENISEKQRNELTDTFLGVMRSLYVTSCEQIKEGLSTIKFLLQNGFVATTDYQKNVLNGFRKGQFSNRAAQFQPRSYKQYEIINL